MKKKRKGETVVPITPASIRVDGVTLDDDDRGHIRRATRTRFGRYGQAVERVTVRIRDVNGPRGGVDIACSNKSGVEWVAERGGRAPDVELRNLVPRRPRGSRPIGIADSPPSEDATHQGNQGFRAARLSLTRRELSPIARRGRKCRRETAPDRPARTQ